MQILRRWLAERGLALSEEKTRITHLTEGFDFLGFNVRLYEATTRTGFKLLIKPSKEAVKSVRAKLRDEWRRLTGANHIAAMRRLNPIIRGWANYHRCNVASHTFHTLDDWMYRKEVRFVRRLHPNKTRQWQQARYWGCLNPEREDHWVFGDKRTGAYLLKFSWFKIKRHVLVKGTASPDDPTLTDYWSKRQAAHADDLPRGHRQLAHQQHQVCPVCGESLFNQEETQTHHIEPRARGGKDSYSNLTLMHLYCHQQVTSAIGAREPQRKWLRPWLA